MPLNNTTNLIVIATIALLIMLNQLGIQYGLSSIENDAKIINRSGKQRMLSQKILAEVYHYHDTSNELTKQKIELIFKELQTIHSALKMGNESLNFQPASKEIQLQLKELDKHINFSESVISEIDSIDSNKLEALRKNQEEFLEKMNTIVSNLQIEADDRLSNAVLIGWGITILAICILVFLYIFAIRPFILKIAQQTKALKEKNAQLEHFAYTASHDLQEPMRTVSTYIDVIREDYEDKLDEDAEIYFNFIQKAIVRMRSLIEGLLNYSRIGQSGKFEKINLNELLEEIQLDLGAKIKERQVQIKLENLPTILCLRTETRQLFQNLITNAIKFTRPDNAPQLEISAKEEKGGWKFAIKDNGIGIPPEKIDKIFGMFTKLHSNKNYSGHGIGLAFCKKIVELHHGKIWVKSTLGTGSTFYFTISKKLENETEVG